MNGTDLYIFRCTDMQPHKYYLSNVTIFLLILHYYDSLYDAGHTVVGVEVAEKAVEDFFTENNMGLHRPETKRI